MLKIKTLTKDKKIGLESGEWFAWRLVYSPQLRYAGRPSLLRKEGGEKIKTLFPRSEERVVERSNDRVS